MSIARHHADWLNLVENTGPFVSLPVLMRAFPQGLEARDAAQAKALRTAYEEWRDNPSAAGLQPAWVLHVLSAVLGYPQNQLAEGQSLPAGMEARMAEMGEVLRPDFALVAPPGSDTAGKAHLLIVSYPEGQALDKPVAGKHWKATPSTRMMELLHGAGVPLGLVTNGEQWMLVYAPPRETTGYASWYATLWLEEPITLRAFHSLLGVRRFFGVDAANTLEGLLKASAQDQQEVTDQLGYQVREAVEVLVQSFDALDKDANRALLKGLPETELYNAALTVMMRLVFLFSAEERGLLHLGKPLYDDNYAVSTLQEQLQEVADRYGEEVLERRYDAWARLLATFRAVHSGIHHQDLLMPAYGGSLFDPDRYPFLEGRAAGTAWRNTPAEPLAVNNRVALHLLSALQRLRVKVPGGGPAESRRISFSALGVEQIGHVYEGLLDHTAVRAREPVLGIKGTRAKEPEIPLAKLESLLAQGQDKLIEFLKDETGRSVSALRKALDDESLLDEHKLLIACGHDATLVARLRPFVGIIREDSFERPVVVLEGSVYVTAGSERRSTGTHYTPPSLTEPIVRHTLEPLVYVGPAEGLSKEEWKLKSPKEILALKVCDMAMGSGAFLVQACRYLAERLVEAWENEEKKHFGEVLITPDGDFSKGSPSERMVPKEAAERVAVAMRYVADRCLYGVDINPMAVEMAKLSLWLITVRRDRPFTFLDHALKCGDSLLGVSSVKQVENFSLRPGVQQFTFETANLFRYVDEASAKRRALEELPSNDSKQLAAKAVLYAEAESATGKIKAIADLLIAFELQGLDGNAYDERRVREAAKVQSLLAGDSDAGIDVFHTKSMLAHAARESLRRRRPFHWPLEFPEVFTAIGFDAFVGNPPFLGGKRISIEHDTIYEKNLKRSFFAKGAADICCYFFRRSFDFLSNELGALGLLATNSITEGDSPKVGIEPIVNSGGTIYLARPSFEWPGQAGVFIAQIHILKGTFSGVRVLEDRVVQFISCKLVDESDAERHKLKTRICSCSAGRQLYGQGFILDETLAKKFLSLDPRNAKVIKPYLNSDIFNDSFDGRSTLWGIDFGEMEEDEAREFTAPFEHLVQFVKPVRDKLTKQVHEDRFWLYWDKRPAFFAEAKQKKKILVCGRHTAHLSFVFYDASWVLTEALQLFCTDSFADFGLLQSSIHEAWARKYSSTIGEGLRYSSSDAFDTFATPAHHSSVNLTAQSYYEARAALMTASNQGLTNTYNRFHDLGETSADIARLRALHVEMDQAVAAAYGWNDLDLGHGFHETKQGVRYTISEPARRTVLDRLLALNHERYAEEVKAGLHDKKTKSAKGRKSKATISEPAELPFEQEENH